MYKRQVCRLLSASGTEIEGVASSTTLFLKGAGGGTFTADVPRDSVVALGEQVYLKSNSTFMLGTVIDILTDDQASSLRVYVRGAYNPVTSNVFYLSK